jgi:hypothetical protein
VRAVLPIAVAIAAGGCNLVFESTLSESTPCKGQPDIVLCLDFEDEIDDGQADDRSPTRANATLGPAITTVERTATNQAILLAELESAVTVPANPALDIVGTLTFEVTVRLDANLMADATILDHPPAYAIKIDPTDGRVLCLIDGGSERVESNAPLGAGFHRITCRKALANLTMFVDGIQQQQTAGARLLVPTNRPTFIGNDAAGETPFVGAVDTVRIWKKALDGPVINGNSE